MSNKAELIFIYIYIVLISFILISCKDNIVNTPITPENDYSPMWPQAGYNAQNTGNPYAPKVKCEPVNGGVVDWYYDFPYSDYGDGAEFCVDSKSNIYFYSLNSQQMKIYKFRPDGTEIWSINTAGTWNFASISLSSDESRIYFNSYIDFYCFDSSGNYCWHVPHSGTYPKPSIGKDGTIYTIIGQNVSAINPDGSIKWKSTVTISFAASYFALDREGNIYTCSHSINKLDKNGNILWEYIPKGQNIVSPGVVIDGYGNIYVNDYSGYLLSLSKNGALRWKVNVGGEEMPAINSSNIIFTSGQSINAIDTGGNILWSKSYGYISFHPIIDDQDNLYFIATDFEDVKAASMNYHGDLRWLTDLDFNSLLPRPALLPMGRMLIAPKRAYKIACVK